LVAVVVPVMLVVRLTVLAPVAVAESVPYVVPPEHALVLWIEMLATLVLDDRFTWTAETVAPPPFVWSVKSFKAVVWPWPMVPVATGVPPVAMVSVGGGLTVIVPWAAELPEAVKPEVVALVTAPVAVELDETDAFVVRQTQ
jgi:hypothetical protein